MFFRKMATAFVAAITLTFGGAALADNTPTIAQPRVDTNLTDQTISQVGGNVPLLYVMLEDPSVAALQNFCSGGCDITFDVVYPTDGAMMGEAVLQVTQVTPAQGERPRLRTRRAIGIDYRIIEENDPATFFAALRAGLKWRPNALFSEQTGS